METEVIPLRTLDKHPDKEEIVKMFNKAIRDFPELPYVYLGVGGEYADCDPINKIVKYPRGERASKVLSYILLYRIIQQTDDSPDTWSFCTIAALARMRGEDVDLDDLPYIDGKLSAPVHHLIPGIAREALEYRKSNRSYIRYFKKRVAEESCRIQGHRWTTHDKYSGVAVCKRCRNTKRIDVMDRGEVAGLISAEISMEGD